jgi:hypothetical protein
MSTHSPSPEATPTTSPPVPPEEGRPDADSSENDDENDEEEEEEEEEEPQLKYERIGGEIAKVCRSDLVSAVCIGSKVIVISLCSRANLTLYRRSDPITARYISSI